MTVLVTVGLASAFVTLNVLSHGSGRTSATRTHQAGATSPRHPATQSETAAAVARVQAGEWMARQLGPGTTVACDPQMCSVLRTAGLHAGRLLVLRLPASDPRGAEIVVATLAVRSLLGARLASVYAPEVIAIFGSGATRIEVRYGAPGVAHASEASQAADRGARAAAGQQLLRNQRILTSQTARTALAAGSVDPRLLVTLAALAAQPAVVQQQMSVVAFGDSSPGVTDAPLRDAEIGTGSPVGAHAMLSFLLAQQPPFQPAEAHLVRQADGQYVVNVQFDAPSPLGLSAGP
ncbi:MAG TPA: hypothetical protein VKU39_06040 [Streptosporangiaceae bacterium]|nr:hypothetical protein [Streptosporangiaceae bacterium]